MGEGVDLEFPEVGKRREEARLVAVERRIADGCLGLVGVAGEAAAKRCGSAGKHARTAVARLNVLGDERRDLEMRLRARREVDHRRRLELFYRVVDGFLNRHNHILTAEVVRELLRKSLRRCGVEDTRHIDEQQIFRADDLGIKGRGYSRVDAARDADDDFLHVDIGEEVADAVVQGAVDMRDVGFLGLFFGRHVLHFGERQDGEFFLIFWQRLDDSAVFIIGRARAVEGVDGLAVVLQADAVDVEERHAGFLGLTSEHAVALVIFAERVRRCRDVDVEVELFLFFEQFKRRKLVIVAPAVLAE